MNLNRGLTVGVWKTQLQLGHASFFPFKFLTAQVLAVLNFLCSHNNNNNKNTFYL